MSDARVPRLPFRPRDPETEGGWRHPLPSALARSHTQEDLLGADWTPAWEAEAPWSPDPVSPDPPVGFANSGRLARTKLVKMRYYQQLNPTWTAVDNGTLKQVHLNNIFCPLH